MRKPGGGLPRNVSALLQPRTRPTHPVVLPVVQYRYEDVQVREELAQAAGRRKGDRVTPAHGPLGLVGAQGVGRRVHGVPERLEEPPEEGLAPAERQDSKRRDEVWAVVDILLERTPSPAGPRRPRTSPTLPTSSTSAAVHTWSDNSG